MSLSDRRRHPRFPFRSRAVLLLDDVCVSGTLIDISFSGALFAVDNHLELQAGAKRRLAIHHRRPQSYQDLDGTANSGDNNLFGIEFLELDDADENDLRLLIDMNFALPDLLPRDLPALLRQPPRSRHFLV